MNERGSASVIFLAVLVFFAACLGGAALFTAQAAKIRHADEEEIRIKVLLRSACDSLMSALASDTSPESDGPGDSIWKIVAEERADGIGLSLEDVSSRLNPNYAALDLIDRSDLRYWLVSGSSAGLSERRADLGLASDIVQYYDQFIPEREKDIGLYSYANINVDEISSLKALTLALEPGRQADSQSAADSFGLDLGVRRSQKRYLTQRMLRPLFGADGPAYIPVISAEPFCNVNFASEALIKGILSYKPLGIANPSELAAEICARRADCDIDSAGLLSLLAGAADSGLALQYLGVKTWFWRVRASLNGRSYTLVTAVQPSDTGASPKQLHVIEAGYSR